MYQRPVVELTNYATVSVEFSAGSMIDYITWVPASEHEQQYGNNFQVAYNDLIVQILFDDKVVFEQPVGNSVTTFTYQFKDSNELHLKQLKIKLTGIQDQHHRLINGIGDAAVMLRIHSIRLEGLNMRLAMEDYGQCVYNYNSEEKNIPSEYMGCDGYQLLEFTTPVYQWLIDTEQKKIILSRYMKSS